MRFLVPPLLGLACSVSLLGADPAARAPEPRTEAQWQDVLRQQPDNEEALFQLGSLRLDAHQPEEAVKYLERAAAVSPGDARVQDALGSAYGLSAQRASIFSKYGLARKCQAAFENAVRLAPREVKYRQSLMTYDLMAPGMVGGGKDKALVQAKAILALSPVDGHRALAQVYGAQEHYADSLAECRAALQLVPDDYGTLYLLGRTAAVSGLEVDQGLAALKTCLTLKVPDGQPPHAAAHWRLGNLHERQRQLALARADYQAALREDPHFQEAKDSLEKLPSP